MEPTLPVYIADQKGFFRQNGLNVTVKYYDVGLHAADGVVKGEVDLATPVAEYVLVGRAFGREKISAIASISRVDYAYIVGRKDHGIKQISDLRGKKIGVVRGTVLDFQLGRFLDLHGMKITDVTLVNGVLPALADALIRGEIDAIMTIPPHISNVESKLAENAVLWPAQNSQPFYSLILGRNDWISKNRDLVKRFLTALNQAETYIADHPVEAKAILKSKMKYSDAEVAKAWSQNKFSLSLDEAIVLAMKDEGRWMISNGFAPAGDLPDFKGYLDIKGLAEVQPDAIDLIR